MKAPPPLKRRPFRQSKHQTPMSTSYIIFDELASRYGLHTVHDWSLEPGAPRTRTSIIEGDDTLTSTARNGNRDLQTYLPLFSAALRRINYKSFSDFWSTRASGLKAKINDRKRRLENSTRIPSNIAFTLEINHHSTFVPVGRVKPIPMEEMRSEVQWDSFLVMNIIKKRGMRTVRLQARKDQTHEWSNLSCIRERLSRNRHKIFTDC